MEKQQPVNDDADEFYTHSDPQSIKYRVIGASIIVLSCSLAWWLFLDHESKRYQSIEPIVKESVKVERFEIPPEVIQKQKAYKERQQTKNSETAEPISAPARPSIAKPKHVESAPKSTAANDETKSVKKIVKKAVEKPSSHSETSIIKNTADKNPSITLADAWVLQVGSFTAKENAEGLRKKLYKSDISAYVKRFKVEDRVIYRVIVGPKLDRRAVEKMQSRVRKKSGIQPLIVKFKIGFEE